MVNKPGHGPAVTTVIPTYRRPRLLRRAIQSVLNQTYPHLRVCVYDNASGDETEAVVREMSRRDSRVSYHRHQHNIGMMANFRFGAERVDTVYFNFLSDDDVVLPRFFETGVKALESRPRANVFMGLMLSVNEDGRVCGAPQLAWETGVLTPSEAFLNFISFPTHTTWTSLLFRSSVLASAGTPDDQLGPPADLDFEARAALTGQCLVSHEPCAIFSSHENSHSGVHWASDFASAHDALAASLARAVDEAYTAGVVADPNFFENAVRPRLREWLIRALMSSLKYGKWDDASKIRAILTSRYADLPANGLVRILVENHGGKNLLRLILRVASRLRDSVRPVALARYQRLVDSTLKRAHQSSAELV